MDESSEDHACTAHTEEEWQRVSEKETSTSLDSEVTSLVHCQLKYNKNTLENQVCPGISRQIEI